MHPAGATGPIEQPTSRTAPRRASQRKASLPRAYMAARQNARRDRSGPVRTGTTQELKHAVRPLSDAPRSSASTEVTGARMVADGVRREEITASRPSAWVARRASHEGMTGPRNLASARSGLATADRWLLAGLMLASSVLVAVLTSALTVRGIERAGAPLVTPSVAARAETTVTVATVPVVGPRDTTPIVRPPRTRDSVLVVNAARVDSAPQHEDGGAVVPPPSPRLSPMPPRAAPPVATVAKHTAPVREKRQLSVAEHVRTPQQSATSSPPITREPIISPPQQPAPVTQTAVQPVQAPPAASNSVASGPSAPASGTAAPAAAPAVNNAQFLEELRAIHAEIDARKRHMDSLTASLDSLKRVKPN
jgi:hypothetical protein